MQEVATRASVNEAVGRSRACFAEQSSKWAADETKARASRLSRRDAALDARFRNQRHVEAVRACDAALQQSLEARAAASRPVGATRSPAVEPSAADDLSSSSDDDSPAAPVKRPPRPVSFLTSAGRVALTPRRLPRLDNVPKYMTWTMATENTLVQARVGRAVARGRALTRDAQEKVQRRLLYADKEGEMIPGTDDSDAEAPVRQSLRPRACHAAHAAPLAG